jgi:hypothetical protein
MASGVYRLADGRAMVDYGKRRGPISCAQYKANGYRPPYEKLPAETPKEAKRDRKFRANAAAPAMQGYDAVLARPMVLSSFQ